MAGVRFAPSPTGRFHIGNLRTAWISHRWARVLGQPWVVRFEDIDGPRVVAGAQELQLRDMAALGCVPDEVIVQSTRVTTHRLAFDAAVAGGVVYACVCSRKEVQQALEGMASAPHGAEAVYSGHCRNRATTAGVSVGWRFRSADPSGAQDFIVGRTDAAGTFAPSYHWACALDDADGGYDLLVRAWDLATALPAQDAIRAWRLGARYEPIATFHTSLVVQDSGERLEKRTRGVTLEEMADRGLDSDALRKIFEQSFTGQAEDWVAGRVWGERKRQLRLSDLR